MDTLKDVRRALKFILRRIESGALEYKKGHTLILGLNALGNLLIDARDSKWTQRAALLWAEREKYLKAQKQQGALPSQAVITVVPHPEQH